MGWVVSGFQDAHDNLQAKKTTFIAEWLCCTIAEMKNSKEYTGSKLATECALMTDSLKPALNALHDACQTISRMHASRAQK